MQLKRTTNRIPLCRSISGLAQSILSIYCMIYTFHIQVSVLLIKFWVLQKFLSSECPYNWFKFQLSSVSVTKVLLPVGCDNARTGFPSNQVLEIKCYVVFSFIFIFCSFSAPIQFFLHIIMDLGYVLEFTHKYKI